VPNRCRTTKKKTNRLTVKNALELRMDHSDENLLVCGGKGQGKAIQLQALTVSEGSRRLMLSDFKTIGLCQ
jgi:predicted AAA+ superfamily ATPase